MKAKKVLAEVFFLILFIVNIYLIIHFFTDSESFKDWEYYILVNVINWLFAFVEYRKGNMYKISTIIILFSELAMLIVTFPVFIQIYASYEKSLLGGTVPITPFF